MQLPTDVCTVALRRGIYVCDDVGGGAGAELGVTRVQDRAMDLSVVHMQMRRNAHDIFLA
jgi:hypothetical protein